MEGPVQVPPDDPLLAHFSGRRRWQRVGTVRVVRVRGPQVEFRARLLDVSEGGVLVHLEDEAFYDAEGGHAMDRIRRCFPEGLEVELPEVDLVLKAQVVRIMPYDGGTVCVGLALDEPLGPGERVLLGLAASQASAILAAAPLRAVPATGRRAVQALLFDAEPHLAGPRLAARVLAMGGRRILLRASAGGSLHLLARRLASQCLRVCLLRGARRVWEGEASLVGVRSAGADGEVQLDLVTVEPLGRAAGYGSRAAAL